MLSAVIIYLRSHRLIFARTGYFSKSYRFKTGYRFNQ